MSIHLLMTGNELMSGDIVDSNSAMIAQALAPHGLSVTRKLTLGDDLDALTQAIIDSAQRCSVLLINGGLGPTVDDLTAQALAKAADLPIERHPEAMEHLQHWAETRGLPLNAANCKQADLPQGVTLIPNPIGTAVGFALTMHECLVLCTPGVPRELSRMLEETLAPLISARLAGYTKRTLIRLTTFGLGESMIQQQIREQLHDWSHDVELGFRAASPILEVKLAANEHASVSLEQHNQRAQQLLGEYLVSPHGDSLPATLLKELQQRKLTVTTAESCTGGLIASQLTRVAGASRVFEQGWVTYSNTAKQQQLKVSKTLLEQHGAVSQAVVEAMLAGALDASGAQVGVAVSGIAGPDGGSKEKPVGTAWIAWGNREKILSGRVFYPVGREQFQDLVAAAAMDLLRRFLKGSQTRPRYLKT